MKFFIINSFRSMVYIAYFAIIAYAVYEGYSVNGVLAGELLGLEGMQARILEIAVFTLAGWIVASVICGLIVTLLDIRDDINDRLPDARKGD